ncbi:MAG: 50S ribosomal protein L9 [Rhabdochlamydiaceae bacterium]|nr:50S ribosomal protein L9 [Rhabdochlamydiaceae bacterium]
MQNQLLLLEDVEDLGRSGDLVTVKPGFARNFLIPQKKAVVADKFTLRLRVRLMEERSKQAAVDRKDAEELASKLVELEFATEVKVDAEGRMYGSVSAVDIVKLCAKEGIALERKNIILPHPIKDLGIHTLSLKLKEGVPATLRLNIYGDRVVKKAAPEKVAPVVVEDEESSS